ncbi:MAG TPA: glycoside hydrolase family 3 N-terminal domain-containing protein, partial [Sphingobacteriaceae bacterium]|nr:glycoside hydrolase family 3 N-terminal domain-containing protein [Sphingobacteriaceae bacterium]
MKRLFFTVLSLFFAQFLFAQKQNDFVDFINRPHHWVDSVFNSLTPAERVGQLFMVRAHSNLGQKYIDSVARVIEAEQLGGIVLFQGGPVRHAHVINQYQKLSKVPLLVALDGEWGVGMRLPDSTISYPYQMTLGAIQDDNLIRRMGVEVAKDFKRLGMHVNFAPVIDVNNNAMNPVIGFRSFGEDKYNVTRKG